MKAEGPAAPARDLWACRGLALSVAQAWARHYALDYQASTKLPADKQTSDEPDIRDAEPVVQQKRRYPALLSGSNYCGRSHHSCPAIAHRSHWDSVQPASERDSNLRPKLATVRDCRRYAAAVA